MRVLTSSFDANCLILLQSGTAPLPSSVRIVEVGPRDGLQNEKQLIPSDLKIRMVNLLSSCGFKNIETTSFVSKKRVPQLADADAVFMGITKSGGTSYSVLTPNMKGFERALQAGAKEIAIFTSASEEFNKKNLNCSIEESLRKYDEILSAASQEGIQVRGYVSVVVGCPYSGKVSPSFAASIAGELHRMGCYEVSMGDTIGVGTPGEVSEMLEECKKQQIPVDQLAVHMHDTYGQALANIYAALQCGVSVVDSSVAGLGGCPFAPGASGNVATEDVIYMLEGLRISTGIDMHKLLNVNEFIIENLGLPNMSRAAAALKLRRDKEPENGNTV